MATKVKTGVIDSSAITSALIANASITADDLHTTLDLTGKTVTVSTASAGDNDTSVASTAYVDVAIANLADSAPSTLDTLNELAAALGDDANYATTTTNAIATKAPLANPDFTGQIQVSNAASTIQELTVTGNNTRSTLRLNSKDSSGNSVDLRMHSLGDGPRAELFTYSNHPLAFATNNAAPQMTLLTNGNFGIGVTNPAQVLEIHNSNASDYTDFALRGTGHKYVIGVGNASVATVNDKWYLYDNDNSAFRMVVDTSGNVGIGTSSPAVKFQVNGTNASIGVLGTPKSDWYTTAYNGLQVADGLTLWGRSSDSHMSGNYYVRDVSGVAKDTYINNGYVHDLWFDNASGDLKYRNAASGSANAEISSFPTRLVIKNSGDVLIGSSTNLDVLSGTPKIQVGDGTGHSSIQFYSNTNAVGALYFGDGTSGVGRYNGYIEYRHSGDTMAFRANGGQKLLLGNDVTTFNDPIETTTDTGTRMYTGLATGSHYASTGYLILDTNIPDPGQSAANMFSIHINGYSYNSALGGIIDLNIGAYSGEGYFHNPSYSGSNIPDKWVNNVRFARKSSTNTVSIILGDSGTAQPIEIAATLFIQGFGSTNASYAKGWDWQIATSTTGYTQLTKVNEKTTKRPSFAAASSGFSVATGWTIISDSMSQTHDGPDDDYNTSNGRFTPQLPGWYQFNFGGWATYNSSTGQERYATAFAKNGSLTYIAGANYSDADSPLSGASQRVYLNGSSDYVELKAYSSVATQWGGSSHWVWWDGYWTGS